jgi:hypothetical protein
LAVPREESGRSMSKVHVFIFLGILLVGTSPARAMETAPYAAGLDIEFQVLSSAAPGDPGATGSATDAMEIPDEGPLGAAADATLASSGFTQAQDANFAFGEQQSSDAPAEKPEPAGATIDDLQRLFNEAQTRRHPLFSDDTRKKVEDGVPDTIRRNVRAKYPDDMDAVATDISITQVNPSPDRLDFIANPGAKSFKIQYIARVKYKVKDVANEDVVVARINVPINFSWDKAAGTWKLDPKDLPAP